MLFAALDHGSRGGAHGPRFLFPLLLLLLIGFLASTIVRRRRGGGGIGGSHSHRSATATLQERFARGEIDRAEFDHRKAVLDGADVIPPAPVAAPTPPRPAPPGPESEPASESSDPDPSAMPGPSDDVGGAE